MKPTKEQLEFVQKVSEFTRHDDQEVLGWSVRSWPLSDTRVTEMVLRIGEHDEMVIRLEEKKVSPSS